jgi:hypothetical protein
MKTMETRTGSLEVHYSTRRETFTFQLRHDEKTLTERFNEANNEEARREDEEFVTNLKRYHRRRFSDEW